MIGVHALDHGTGVPPQFGHTLDGACVGPVRRGEDQPVALEQGIETGGRARILGAGDGMGGNQMDAAGKMSSYLDS